MRESKRNTAIIIAEERGYKVLDDGSVISPTGKRMNPRPDTEGYLRFNIKDDGETLHVMVHKLAAFQRFGGVIFEEDQEVRHINNIRTDNAKGNVSFGTHSDNMMDVAASIRMHCALASALPKRKLSVPQVRELRALRKDGWTIRQLCKKYGLAISTVSYIINRKTYYDV
jgi:hypothetical protein